jgi:uncharacterized membrane protein
VSQKVGESSAVPEASIEQAGGPLEKGAPPGVSQRQPVAFVAAQASSYTGPIPPPEMLAAYERVTPGLGTKLVEAFLSEGDHRRELERRSQQLDEQITIDEAQATRLGMCLAFGVVVIFAGVAVFAFSLGHPWAGASILGATLLGLVRVFVVGRKAQVLESRIQADRATTGQPPAPNQPTE